MLRAAVEAARSVNPALMVLGVTVLTSMDDQDLDKVGVTRTRGGTGVAPCGAGHHQRLSGRGCVRPGSC